MKYTIIVETSSGSTPLSEGNSVGLLTDLAKVEVAINFTEIDFHQKPNLDFMYQITHSDSRVWDQDIHIPASGESTMKFSVPAWWTEDEFASQRDLRAHLIHLAQNHSLTKLKITKTP